MKRITLLDFIRVSWREAKLAVGIFAVETITHADSVGTLNILGKFLRPFNIGLFIH